MRTKSASNLISKDAEHSLRMKMLCTLQITLQYFEDDIEGNQLENTYFKTLQRVHSNWIMGNHLLWVKKY